MFSLSVTLILLCFLSIYTKCEPDILPISKPLRHHLEDFASMTMAYEEKAQIDCINTSRQLEFSCGTKNFPCLCFAYANLSECFIGQINSHQYITYKGYSQHYCAQAAFDHSGVENNFERRGEKPIVSVKAASKAGPSQGSNQR